MSPNTRRIIPRVGATATVAFGLMAATITNSSAAPTKRLSQNPTPPSVGNIVAKTYEAISFAKNTKETLYDSFMFNRYQTITKTPRNCHPGAHHSESEHIKTVYKYNPKMAQTLFGFNTLEEALVNLQLDQADNCLQEGINFLHNLTPNLVEKILNSNQYETRKTLLSVDPPIFPPKQKGFSFPIQKTRAFQRHKVQLIKEFEAQKKQIGMYKRTLFPKHRSPLIDSQNSTKSSPELSQR